MNQFFEWIRQLAASWKFWIVVPPWDVAIRVRLGKRAVALGPGPHFRIPMIDEIQLVNTRLRLTTVPPVIIQSVPGKVRSVMATVGFYIRDPLSAALSFDQPAAAVQAYAQAETARHPDANACAEALAKHLADKGIEVAFVRFVEDVEVMAIRLLQNSWGIQVDNAPIQPGTVVRY